MKFSELADSFNESDITWKMSQLGWGNSMCNYLSFESDEDAQWKIFSEFVVQGKFP
jgi:hypothetical protein